jgi:hypothetical protein
MKYVVDTSIINKLVDGKIDPSELPTDGEFIATHIQIDELNKTKDDGHRTKLLQRFIELGPDDVPTETFVLDTSQLGDAQLGDGITFRALKDALDVLNGGKQNNTNDALIAEVSINNGFTLLTADYHLNAIVESYGGQVRYWNRP